MTASLNEETENALRHHATARMRIWRRNNTSGYANWRLRQRMRKLRGMNCKTRVTESIKIKLAKRKT